MSSGSFGVGRFKERSDGTGSIPVHLRVLHFTMWQRTTPAPAVGLEPAYGTSDATAVKQLTGVYHNLLRQWADT